MGSGLAYDLPGRRVIGRERMQRAQRREPSTATERITTRATKRFAQPLAATKLLNHTDHGTPSAADSRQEIWHHEGHEEHEEERGKEAFCNHDSPCTPGETPLNSHPSYLFGFAALSAIHQEEWMPMLTERTQEFCNATISPLFVFFVPSW